MQSQPWWPRSFVCLNSDHYPDWKQQTKEVVWWCGNDWRQLKIEDRNATTMATILERWKCNNVARRPSSTITACVPLSIECISYIAHKKWYCLSTSTQKWKSFVVYYPETMHALIDYIIIDLLFFLFSSSSAFKPFPNPNRMEKNWTTVQVWGLGNILDQTQSLV
jgi:hypothetical protein